jgi:hypothetical protein
MKDCLNYFVNVPKKDIHFWCPFFEAYEGMLSLRTPEPPKGEIGTIHFMVSPDFKDTFEELIRNESLTYVSAEGHGT